jgi:uroporphyrin-III C-methyltransferase
MAKAYLVGAGPGDPRLLTIAAAEAIQAADVILCDRLVSDEIVTLARANARIIYVGKHPGEQAVVQAKIFAFFLEYAAQNKVLVRLKGGDPYVFGRGSEEYISLRELGYDVTVVPGISSAIAVPALAGIPVTARGVSAAFAVVTGHCCGDEKVSWAKFAQIDTLVVLMGVSERASIARELIAAGRPKLEPIAFVENGSTASQRIVRSNLAAVANGEVDVSSPAIFIIGAVTQMYEQLQDAHGEAPPAEWTVGIQAASHRVEHRRSA